jgi:prepilin peptidase CpaA
MSMPLTLQKAWIVLPLAGALLAAACIDLRSRRIPNQLCLVLLISGILLQAAQGGGAGLAAGLAGAAVGFAALIPLHAMGGLGAGDVKLMAAACAWLNLKLALVAVAATLLIGGAMGLLVAALLLLFRSGVSPGVAVGLAIVTPSASLSGLRGSRFPYALAIAAGVITALLLGEGTLQ